MEDLQALQAQITRVADTLAVEQVIFRYLQWLALYRADKVVECFADRDDSTVEISSGGVNEGYEAIKKLFERTAALGKEPGTLVEHYMVCPIIEVARDGKTAKATGFAPGIVSIATAGEQGWNWGKYEMTCIKERGEWKIWHLHWFQMFGCSYEKGWLHEQTVHAAAKIKGGLPPTHANRPTTYHKLYDPTSVNYFLPEPPEPYETWGE